MGRLERRDFCRKRALTPQMGGASRRFRPPDIRIGFSKISKIDPQCPPGRAPGPFSPKTKSRRAHRPVGNYTGKSPLRRRWILSGRFRSAEIRLGLSKNVEDKSPGSTRPGAWPPFSAKTYESGNSPNRLEFRRQLALTPRWGQRARSLSIRHRSNPERY